MLTTKRLVQRIAYRVSGYFLPVALLLSISGNQRVERDVRVVPNEKGKRIDVIIDGEPFTSYIWPETLLKPVLYPVRTAKGTVVTRSFPLEPRAGESVDHPHQVGLWLSRFDSFGSRHGLSRGRAIS